MLEPSACSWPQAVVDRNHVAGSYRSRTGLYLIANDMLLTIQRRRWPSRKAGGRGKLTSYSPC
jgi:hypothetical protein